MKNKYLLTIIFLLFFTGMFLYVIYYVDGSVRSIMILLFGGLFIGVINKLIKAYTVPTDWMFVNRFGIDGMLTIVPVLFLISIWMNSLSLASIIVDLIFGGVFGFFLVGFANKNNYKKKDTQEFI